MTITPELQAAWDAAQAAQSAFWTALGDFEKLTGDLDDADIGVLDLETFLAEFVPDETKPFRCDQCEAAMINGVFCHETGCVNSRKTYVADRDMWVLYLECSECGDNVEEGESCDCRDTDWEPEPEEEDEEIG